MKYWKAITKRLIVFEWISLFSFLKFRKIKKIRVHFVVSYFGLILFFGKGLYLKTNIGFVFNCLRINRRMESMETFLHPEFGWNCVLNHTCEKQYWIEFVKVQIYVLLFVSFLFVFYSEQKKKQCILFAWRKKGVWHIHTNLFFFGINQTLFRYREYILFRSKHEAILSLHNHKRFQQNQLNLRMNLNELKEKKNKRNQNNINFHSFYTLRKCLPNQTNNKKTI